MNQIFKICRVCNENKSLSDFTKNAFTKDGYMNICKKCKAAEIRELRLRNPPTTEDRERAKQNFKKWYNANKGRHAHNLRKREKQIKEATPKDANLKIIRTFYEMSDRLSKCLGIPFHVDHLVPISRQGQHHETNLLPVPASVNLEKNNKCDLSHPFYSHLNF
jgi:transcription initiation factor TFIIIB Brf1 subunit/transcription initiation factor TFIIB